MMRFVKKPEQMSKRTVNDGEIEKKTIRMSMTRWKRHEFNDFPA